MSCDTGPASCVRKHIESNDTYYVDLAPKLGTGETVSSVTSVTCSDAQTAAETYVLSIGGNTYTVDYSGLDASGNRGTTTLTKA